MYPDRIDLSVLRDSDGDGVSDFDEVYLYGTDPYDAYTGGSVLTDGERIALGLDPRSTSPERILVASPQLMGGESSQYRVTEILLQQSTADDTGDTITFRGLAPLNSVVTLVLFSEPIVVTVKANQKR
jgi:hypothetical protein